MTTLIGDFLNLVELNQRRLCAFFRPPLGESHINLGKGVKGSFPAIQHPPQRGDNETQTGLKVQKPFLSHWEHVLDAHSIVLSCMLLSALAAERSVPGKCPQGPLESPGLEEVGLRPVRRSGLGDKPSCLLQRRWEHVNKSLIRAIVFIPFSSQLNGLLPSHGAVYLERDKEKEWNGWGYKRF